MIRPASITNGEPLYYLPAQSSDEVVRFVVHRGILACDEDIAYLTLPTVW